MTFQSAPECAEAVIQFEMASRPMFNVLNFRKPDGYTQADIDALAAAVDSAVGAVYINNIMGGISYVNTHVRGLADPVDLEAEVNDNAGTGTYPAGSQLPGNATMAVRLSTGFSGRSARGRVYVMPGSTNMLSGPNTFAVGAADTFIDAIEEIRVQALAAGWVLVVLSRRNGGFVLATAEPRAVTSITYANTKVDSAKRRLAINH